MTEHNDPLLKNEKISENNTINCAAELNIIVFLAAFEKHSLKSIMNKGRYIGTWNYE